MSLTEKLLALMSDGYIVQFSHVEMGVIKVEISKNDMSRASIWDLKLKPRWIALDEDFIVRALEHMEDEFRFAEYMLKGEKNA